ncbi:SAM-dependent methyltransferase [Acidocella aminolytica]|uniref:Methyltransferase n=1 Tax=Acidocella aminolytica 101 = DSM 11237 TaxID=1120923 RepID=A0A0D6PJT6_9PROT|nr:class I SAM-dependent methyltransferase [Acidocella aminolytica]GAN81661.1 methyltransferase [Acidocella aminolytica 101 = DSM 11237]GBQ43102.1 SAM-dependent methyltransferase [Acidocella aminolytica 101 = DSM 11237]SHF53564.1 Methyltransferase domain-containing protein [Acidocella aminolytica 101 = DSM 11237]
MPELSRGQFWEQRFAATDTYIFGETPNAFLVSQAKRIKPGDRVLAVADGEGRNGVFLAGLGAQVHAIELSAAAIAKAKRLAASRGLSLNWEQVDVTDWTWPEAAYDVVAAIFVQFITPDERQAFFTHLKRALKPGGVLLMQGYRPEQRAYKTGGPPEIDQLYTEAQLRDAFSDMEIVELRAHDSVIEEGGGHSGMSALIDLVAVRPTRDELTQEF